MRRRNKKKNSIMLLLLLVVTLGIGYALISTNLTINGVGKFVNQSWNIHFEDLTLNPGNVSLSQEDVAATINQTTLTDITFTVTLQEPGDFYEFEVAAVNSGTMDAMIGLITNNLNGNPIGTGNEVPAFAKYTATYFDGIEIAPNHLLEAGYSETYKVRVEYRTDIDPEDLPEEVQELTFNFGVQYVQADANAIPKPLPSFADDPWENIISNVRSGNLYFYHVGDTKTVELGNDLGTHTIRIANTSTPAECSTTGFSQSACGFVLEFADAITTHSINTADTTNGGWPASEMRSFVNETIYNSLPSIIKEAIIDTTVVTGYSPKNGTNFTSIDKIFLLSTHEVWEDVNENTNDGIDYYDTAYNNTRQLDYYNDLGTTIGAWNSSISSYDGNYSGAIKRYNGLKCNWWLRTPEFSNVNGFAIVRDTGRKDTYSAPYTGGVSPAFRIG